MGIVQYRPEDTFYYTTNTLSSDGQYTSIDILLANHSVTINFPTGYINYRLGYTDEPNVYTYTYLNEQLNENRLTYYRGISGELYNTDNDYHGAGHTFTYEIESSDAYYNDYRIYSDQFIEVHDDDGHGGGGAWQDYYKSVDLLRVDHNASESFVRACINSYIVKGEFAVNVHGTNYYARYVGGTNLRINRSQLPFNLGIIF